MYNICAILHCLYRRQRSVKTYTLSHIAHTVQSIVCSSHVTPGMSHHVKHMQTYAWHISTSMLTHDMIIILFLVSVQVFLQSDNQDSDAEPLPSAAAPV